MSGGGGTGTTGRAATGTSGRGDGALDDRAPQEPAAPPDRADISLAVLNGTNTAGLRGQTAGQAEGLGYAGVTPGNAPTTTGPTIVYFRPGQRAAAAARGASDLQVDAVAAAPGLGRAGRAPRPPAPRSSWCSDHRVGPPRGGPALDRGPDPPVRRDWDEVRDAALRAEALGFDGVWVNDHLQSPGPPEAGPDVRRAHHPGRARAP